MAYIGIGYTGDDPKFLRRLAEEHIAWLKADRMPRFFGDAFVVLYDSNTAREFVSMCRRQAPKASLCVYPMERSYEY
jgi:hypothetical protein